MTGQSHSENIANQQELAASRAYLRAFAPLPPPSTCPISWQPNALQPVFYGVRDYSATDGAPANIRVFFPSLDGDVFAAQMFKGYGRYPLILFVHGDCELDNPDVQNHYKLWHAWRPRGKGQFLKAEGSIAPVSCPVN